MVEILLLLSSLSQNYGIWMISMNNTKDLKMQIFYILQRSTSKITLRNLWTIFFLSGDDFLELLPHLVITNETDKDQLDHQSPANATSRSHHQLQISYYNYAAI